MKIEITGLPEGQKIQHINVDITFEEDGTPIVETKQEMQEKSLIRKNTEAKKNDVSENQHVPGAPVPPIINNDNREQKEVPSEMTDMEF